jgi:hypothetical protein
MTSIYVATPQGLLVLRGRPPEWQTSRQLDGLPAQCLAADPLRLNHVYCGAFGRGLWVSDDAGDSWRPVGEGIRSPQLMAIAVSATERVGGPGGERGVVYAGTEPSALYRSEDGGATWQELAGMVALPSAPTWSFPPRPYTSHVRAIGLDPHAAGHLYIAIEAGALVRSFDGGQTWVDRVPTGPYDTHTLGLPPQAPGTLYSAAGDGFMQPGQGFAVSRDGGASWERAGEGTQYLWGLAVDPADPGTLVVSSARGPREAHDAGSAESAIFRRQGREGAWERVMDGLPPARGTLASVLAANPAEPGVFYAANNRGVYRSPDAGRSWERLAIAWPDTGDDLRRPAALLVTEA